MENDEFIIVMIIGITIGAYALTLILAFSGAFDSPVTELELDKDLLAEYHILNYYPEYENCSFKYKGHNQIDCDEGVDGVDVFCSGVEHRDGMSVLDSNADLTLCFDDIELEDILKEIVKDNLIGLKNG